MKTTIELPERLFRRAKAAAATEGITLKQLFTEALRHRLESGVPDSQGAPWRQLAGELSDLRRETRRIQREIDNEFEQLDDEPNAP